MSFRCIRGIVGIWLIGLIELALFAGPASTMEVATMAQRADLVVHGRVLRQQCRRDDAGRIYTETHLQVAEVWKGRCPSSEISIVNSGGNYAGETVVVTGQVVYRPEEEVVAFLVWNIRGQAVTLGLSQGKFEVVTDPQQGRKTVRHPSELGWGRDPRTPSSGEATVASATALSLEDLKRRVRQAAQSR